MKSNYKMISNIFNHDDDYTSFNYYNKTIFLWVIKSKEIQIKWWLNWFDDECINDDYNKKMKVKIIVKKEEEDNYGIMMRIITK